MIDVGRVAMVPVESILVSDRARKDMGNLEETRTNMQENGLITPLCVLDLRNGAYLLLAGGRRFAILSTEEGVTSVPCRIFDKELSEIELLIIEDSENFFRKDMTWQERDLLTSRIHKLKQELYGVKSAGPSEGWGLKDTAEMLGAKSKSEIGDSLKRAALLQQHPELFEGIKTAKDASKVVQKVSEAAIKQQIVAKLETQTADASIQKLNNAYIVRDFFAGVKELPDKMFHLVEIDPPYGIDLRHIKQKETNVSQYQLEEYNEIPVEEYPLFLEKVFKECYRVMADNSWLICWFGPEPWYQVTYKKLREAGFEVTRNCGIWAKTGTGQCNQPNYYLANGYEMFFYAWKGRPVINMSGRTNVFHYAPVPPQQKVHPTERPIELMKDIYNTFAFPGSRVLIPFLGSGVGLLAATSLDMSSLGFDLSKSHKDSFLVKANNLLNKK